MAEGGALNYLNSTPVFTFGNTLRTIDQKKKEQLYQQQYNQKLYQQNAAMLQKQMEGIRSADIPEFMNMYNRYSNAQKYLLANPSLIKKNPEEYAKAKQDADAAYSGLFQLANESKETAGVLKDINEDGYKNWQRYKDGIHDYVNQLNNVPSSQISSKDYLNPTHILYQGTNRDLNKDFKDVIGAKPTPYEENLGLTDDKINDKIQKYQLHNTPIEILHGLTGIAGERTAQKDYQVFYDQGKQSGDYDAVREAYDKMLQDPTVKRLWVKNDYDTIPDNVKDTPLGYAAMKASLMAAPEDLGFSTKENPKAKMDYQKQKDIELENLRHQHRLSEQQSAEKLKEGFYKFKNGKDAAQQDKVLDDVIEGQYNSGAEIPFTLDGKSMKGRVVALPAELQKLYNSPDVAKKTDDKGYVVTPDQYVITDDKKYLVPIYFDKKGGETKTTPSGNPYHTSTFGDAIPITKYKTDLGGVYLSKKDWTDEMSDEPKSTARPQKATKTTNWNKYKR